MEEITKQLEEIITEQLKVCNKKKKVPSKKILDTIHTLNLIIHSC